MAKIISVSLPHEADEQLAELTHSLGLRGRSETVRAALSLLSRDTADMAKLKGSVNALLVVTHTHAHGIDDIMHKSRAEITTRMHHHVHGTCVEVFFLSGKADSIKVLMGALARNKKVSTAKLLLL